MSRPLLRAVTDEVTGASVAAPHPGALIYRLCVTSSTRSPMTAVAVNAAPLLARRAHGTGSVRRRRRSAPRGRSAANGRLTASSSLPVSWIVRASNGDGSFSARSDRSSVTATSIDQVVGPGPFAYLDVCVTNHSTGQSASLAMRFSSV